MSEAPPLPAAVTSEPRNDEESVVQAERFRRRFPDWGRWGLSALFARGDDDVDDLGAGPLVRIPLLGIYRVSALEAAGFEVVPMFRTPHVTTGFTGNLADGLERLRGAIHEQRPNPYHGSGPEEVTP